MTDERTGSEPGEADLLLEELFVLSNVLVDISGQDVTADSNFAVYGNRMVVLNSPIRTIRDGQWTLDVKDRAVIIQNKDEDKILFMARRQTTRYSTENSELRLKDGKLERIDRRIGSVAFISITESSPNPPPPSASEVRELLDWVENGEVVAPNRLTLS